MTVMSVTVTTPLASGYDDVVLKVWQATNVTEAGGSAVTGPIHFTTPPEFSLTPAGNGSLVLAGLSNVASGTEAWTPAANNTTDNTGGPTTRGAGWWYGHYTGTTAAGTPITLGCSETTNDFFTYAGYELLASGSPAISSDSPPAVGGNATAATTAQFTMHANAVLVAMVLTTGSAAQTFTVVDSSGLGLTWTLRGTIYSSAFNGTAAIYTTTLPAVIPPSPITQSASAQAGSGGPITATFGSNVTAGSKMLAYVQASDPNEGIYPGTTVADSHGNPFFLIAQVLSIDFVGHNTRGTLWALDTPAADAGTKAAITATLAGDADVYGSLLIQELPAGLLAACGMSPLDGIPVTLCEPAGEGTITTGSPPYSSGAAGEFLIAFYADDGAFQTSGGCTWTPPAGWNYDPNSFNSSAGGDLAVSYKKSAGGAETSSYTVIVPSEGTDWGLITAAFLPSVTLPSIATTALLPARASSAYSYQLAASGGTAPYAWSVSSGSLPGWATLNAVTGVISGTAPGGAGTTTFTVKVTDGASNTATKLLTLGVIVAANTTSANQSNWVSPAQSPQITGNVSGVNASTPYTNPNAFNPQSGQSQTMTSYTATDWLFSETVSNAGGSVTAYPSTGFYYSEGVPITDYPYLVSGWDSTMDWSNAEYGAGIIASCAYDLWFVAEQSSEVMIHGYLQSRGSGPWFTDPVVFGGYSIMTSAGPIYIPPQYWRLSWAEGDATSYWIKVNASGAPEWPGLPAGTVDVLAMLKYLVNPLGIWPSGRLPSFIGFGFGFEVCSTQGAPHNFSVNNFFWYGGAAPPAGGGSDDAPWHIRRRQ